MKMPQSEYFHDVRFPTEIALGARGGPERRTDIVELASGHEHRNSRWLHPRRRYNAGYGIKNFLALERVLHFFEERRGRLYGFRFKDRLDCTSAPPGKPTTDQDQIIGTGNGKTTTFQLLKRYGLHFSPYARPITKPDPITVKVAVDGASMQANKDFTVDGKSGLISFTNTIPGEGAKITAGFSFDVPVRFDTDFLEIDLASFEAGEIPNIPLIELRDQA